jgi:hypothetical protein
MDKTKNPITVIIIVPQTTSVKGFFCSNKPIRAINARNAAPCSNIS